MSSEGLGQSPPAPRIQIFTVLPSSKPGQDLLSISPVPCALRSSLGAPLSQPTRPRLTALHVDGRGGGHGRFVLKRQRYGDRHGCQVGRGARLRGGARGCGDQDFGCGADVSGEAQPCRGVAVGGGESWLARDLGDMYETSVEMRLHGITRAAVCM